MLNLIILSFCFISTITDKKSKKFLTQILFIYKRDFNLKELPISNIPRNKEYKEMEKLRLFINQEMPELIKDIEIKNPDIYSIMDRMNEYVASDIYFEYALMLGMLYMINKDYSLKNYYNSLSNKFPNSKFIPLISMYSLINLFKNLNLSSFFFKLKSNDPDLEAIQEIIMFLKSKWYNKISNQEVKKILEKMLYSIFNLQGSRTLEKIITISHKESPLTNLSEIYNLLYFINLVSNYFIFYLDNYNPITLLINFHIIKNSYKDLDVSLVKISHPNFTVNDIQQITPVFNTTMSNLNEYFYNMYTNPLLFKIKKIFKNYNKTVISKDFYKTYNYDLDVFFWLSILKIIETID